MTRKGFRSGMKKEREEYLEIIRRLHGDWQGRATALEYVKQSDCYVYGFPAPFSFVPTFYNDSELEYLSNICETTHDILCKVIAQYLSDVEYRKLFAFSKEVERLILLPCNYEEKLPIARFDFFLDEDDLSFRFCEFNADGAAAMSRTLIGCEAVERSATFQKFAQKYKLQQFELFDTWVDEFLATYYSDKNAVEHPTVLITDFTENVTMSDVTRYVNAFEKKGIPVRYVDIRKLGYDERGLYDPTDGMVFDAVYRRAVTSDVVRFLDACHNFISAVEDEKVCLIGHFRTTVVHSKMINIALLDQKTQEILNDREWSFVKEHILPTFRLRKDTPGLDISVIKQNKDGWILKPEDDYDSHGVFAGVDMTEEEWEHIVTKYTDAGYVAMEFYTPPLCAIALPEREEESDDPYGIENWHSMTGTYSFNGKHCGFFSRMGKEGVISESHHGVSIPSYHIFD